MAHLPFLTAPPARSARRESIDGDTSEKVDTLASRLDNAEAATAALATNVGANKDTCAKLAEDLKDLKAETEKSAATEVEIAASWLAAVNRVHPTNKQEPTDIVVVGKNFGQYDFSPVIMPYFQCTYVLSTDAKKTHVTVGQTKRTQISDVRAFIYIRVPCFRTPGEKSAHSAARACTWPH